MSTSSTGCQSAAPEGLPGDPETPAVAAEGCQVEGVLPGRHGMDRCRLVRRLAAKPIGMNVIVEKSSKAYLGGGHFPPCHLARPGRARPPRSARVAIHKTGLPLYMARQPRDPAREPVVV